MTEAYLGFLIFLTILAVIVREDYLFVVLYLFAGAFIIGGWWSRKAVNSLVFKRSFQDRVFLDEEVPVKLEVMNKGWLPLIWLRVHDSLPVELAISSYFRQVFSLGPRENKQFEYKLFSRKRGLYRIGPISAWSGDVLGLQADQSCVGEPDYLTVYPRVIPLTNLHLPSRSPMGTLRHRQPIFEDPSRVLNKRDYMAGDSLRRVDWKTSASIGRLQVKQFEPSIALQTGIFLNLNIDDYDLHTRFAITELSIVVAASIASWVIQHKQSVGLSTNGLDPLPGLIAGSPNSPKDMPMAQALPSRKGQAHLMRILDILARIYAGESMPFINLLQQECSHFSWGATLVLITPQADGSLIDELFSIRRSGVQVVLALVGQPANYPTLQQIAKTFKFPLYRFATERDLDIWRH